MPPPTTPFAEHVPPVHRLEVLFDEMGELTGQRNAIDGRLVEIIAEIDGAGTPEGNSLWGATGCRSIEALVAWKTGVSPRRAQTMVAVAHRLAELSHCAQGLREGRLSLDQIGVIAENAAEGSDEHYAELVQVATVTQLRTAVKQEPQPEPEQQKPEPTRKITKTEGDDSTTWRITLPKVEAAKFEAGLNSHRDALVADWKRDHDAEDSIDPEDGSKRQYDAESKVSEQAPPFPNTVDAFMSLVEAGWDAEVAARPHGQHTTVVVHVDVEKPVAALHLGSALTADDRQYLLCDATCEVWFERHGRPIGAGRTTRTISRRLRRALEHRDQTCVVPGCGAARGLHAHHLVHWEDGGPTELWNLVLVCPFHHRQHHRGVITLTGPADTLKVTDENGDTLTGASLARPPTTPPPDVPPCPGPLGERAQWWWYTPFEPPPPTTN
ncbi:HNH endonuclease signature motif containing protein [Mycolicibacterium sp. P9-22]|uniref:HNH endonuclease signature motif containing protein n=1 Tax=Mycolicibacterium sp. P9-22 TaxID=2024613 RepID=UPI0011F00D0B|nr:HNH endonuclease signature motif containing protein [Mycolicibacterium sp. P9-22]KAA0120469.1 HNH endonuclease [Mycolicibacterium sp. P9-22]